jgi:hypothetical protein
VQTTADSQQQRHATTSNFTRSTNGAYDTCMTDAKFGLVEEEYNDDRSKITSFSCSMCEHRFPYSGQRYMTRHIHTCCEKYPVKANAFGLATGTCMSCLRGRPCERMSTTSAGVSNTSTSGTKTTTLDIPVCKNDY